MKPRMAWLRERVIEVVDSMKKLEEIEDWEQYRVAALDLSTELHYAVTEWEKYYNEE